MKKAKKLIALLLSVLMVMATIPMTTYATATEEANDYTEIAEMLTGRKDVEVIIANASGSSSTSGTTGQCTWTLSGTVLTISGNGKMGDYYSNLAAPWGTSITKVIINYGVTNIGQCAFANCTSLTSVTIPSSVTTIESNAFEGCTALTSVSLPSSITRIGGAAFYGCNGLTTITIPSRVEYLGNMAFAYCNNLTTVDYDAENCATYDGYYAYNSPFMGCNNLSTVNFDYYVKVIPKNLFRDCASLTYVYMGSGTKTIGSSAFSGCTGLKSISFSYNLTNIGSYAFYNCTGLTSLTIPDRVTTIGDSAFEGCTGLTKANIGQGITEIGYSAFKDCASLKRVYITNLKAWCGIYFYGDDSNPLCYANSFYLNNEWVYKLVIPEGTTKIGNYAFNDCVDFFSLSIPESVTSIGDHAFSGCTGISTVTIPDSVTSIGTNAFNGCNAITGVTLGKGITTIGQGAFKGCSKLKTVKISDIKAWCNIDFKSSDSNPLSCGVSFYVNDEILTNLVIPDGVTAIKNYAFYDCNSITSVTIPDDVTSIGDYAFYGCGNIEGITNSNNLSSIGIGAFYWCSKLTSITLPNGIAEIPDNAFNSCKALTGVIIPDGVASIGKSAFSGCSALTTVKLGKDLKAIGSSAFSGCSALERVDITDNYVWYNIEFANSTSNPLYYAQKLYLNGVLMTDIVIPDGITKINDYIFYNCSGLINITIPDSITSIGAYSFYNCSGLKNVTVGSGVESIAAYAFSGCSDLEAVYIKDLTAWCNIDFYYDTSNPFLYAKKLYLNGKLVKDLVIPDGVTKIKTYAFLYLDTIDSIIIPNSVTIIDKYAFYGCSSVKSLNIGSGVESIGDSAFYMLPKELEKITVDSANNAYHSKGNCLINSETNVVLLGCKNSIIPYYATGIAYSAFEYCYNLKYMNIPDKVESIGAYAFSGCTALQTITISGSVKTIGSYAFLNCSALTIVNIPYGVNSIGSYSFSGCSSLKSLVLSHSVTQMSGSIFYNCDELIYVYYTGSKTTADKLNITDEVLKNASWYYNYDPDKVETDVYTITIYDRITGKPVVGATVVLGDIITSTDSKGRARLVLEDYSTTTLKINAQNYPEYFIQVYVPYSSQKDTIYITSTETDIIDAWCNGSNVLKDKAQINNYALTLSAEIIIYARSYYNILKYELVQDSVVIATSYDGEFSVSNLLFTGSKDVYARVYTDGPEGKSVYERKLNIKVVSYTFNFSSDFGGNLPFSGGIDLTFPNGVPLLEGFNIKIPKVFGKNSALSFSVENDKLMVTIGLKKDYTKDPEFKKLSSKDRFAKILSDWTKEKKDEKTKEVYGSLVFIVEFSDKGITKTYGQLNVGINLGFEFGQTFMVWFVPLYGEVAVEFGAEVTLGKLGYDFENGEWLIPEFTVGLEGGVTLYGGLGCSVISAGVYGSLKAKLEFIFNDNDDDSAVKFTLSGELGIYAKVKPLFWKEIPYKLPIFSGEKTWPEQQRLMRMMMYSLNNYETSNRAYLENRTEWLNQAIYALESSQYTFLQDSTYDSIEPKIVTCGNTTVMFFMDDDGSAGYNYQHLYYSIYDKATGGWSTPKRVDSNACADLEFDVYSDGSNIYVAYTEINTVTDENKDNYAAILGTVEVSFAKYDFTNNCFIDFTNISNNNSFDTNPQIISTANGVMVAWVNNGDNSVFLQNNQNSVMLATLTLGKWSIETLIEESESIVSLDIGTLNGKIYVAVIRDLDCDNSTIDDHIIYLVDLDGNVTEIVTDTNENMGIKFINMNGTNMLVWYNGSNLYKVTSANDTPAIFVETIEGLNNDYKFVDLGNGKYAIVYIKNEVVEDSSESLSSLYAVYYENGVWGSPVCLVKNEIGYYIDAFDVFVSEGKLVVPYINSFADFTTEDIIKTSSFMSVSVELSNDLLIGNAEFDYSDLFDGGEVEITVSVTNNSSQKINNLTYSIIDTNGNVIFAGTVVVEGGIVSGDTKEITIIVSTELLTAGNDYSVVIDTTDYLDKDLLNNASKLDLWQTDFGVDAWQESDSDFDKIQYIVTNNGNVGGDVLLVLYALNENGERVEFDRRTINDLAVGKSISGFFVIIDEYYEYGMVYLDLITTKYDVFDYDNSIVLPFDDFEDNGTQPGSGTVIESPVVESDNNVFDRENPQNVIVKVDEKGSTFVSISGITEGSYTYANGTLTISKDYLATLSNGTHFYILTYTNSGKTLNVICVVEVVGAVYITDCIAAPDQVVNYDGNAVELNKDIYYSTDSEGEVTAEYSVNGIDFVNGLPKDVGTYIIRLTVARDTVNKYEKSVCTFTLTITKPKREISAPVIIEKNDTQVKFGNSFVIGGNGTVLYGYSNVNDVSTVTNWSTEGILPNYVANGTYYLFAMVAGDDIYVESYSSSLKYTFTLHKHKYTDYKDTTCDYCDYTRNITASGTTGQCYWTVEDGTILTISGYGSMVNYTSVGPWGKNITQVIIEDGVTNIGTYAFYNCKSITSVTIGNSVTSIGTAAFYNCSQLTSISVPDSVASIGNSAFYGCTNLKGVYINDIAAWCNIDFANNTANPLNYAKNIYLNGELITNLVIPVSVKEIKKYTFRFCESLISVIVPNSVTNIWEYAFSNCKNLKNIAIPNSLKGIGFQSFYNCTSLVSMTIPDSVTSIDDGAFYGCIGLTSIIIPNSVTYIGANVFYGCSSLTSVTLSNNITNIFNQSFYNCSSLTSIIIPDSVTSIGVYAFYGCSSLESITIGKGVEKIGETAFYGCNAIKSVNITDIAAWCNIDFEDGYSCPHDFSDSLYLNGKLITSLVIPQGVKEIKNYAFGSLPHITSVILPDSVTSIGELAFFGCSGLTSISISRNVTSIGKQAFYGCDSLTSITIPDAVTSIGNYAFAYCTNITNITIGNGVTTIGDYAFKNCESLVSITVVSGNRYYYSEDDVLFNATNKELMVYPQAKTESAYVVPSDVVNIGSDAFRDCINLTSITISDNVTNISKYAFYGCTGLTNVVIPNNVIKIDSYAFKGCTGLKSVIFGNGLQSIGSDAFRDCFSLTSIIIPDNVLEIDGYAFYDCYNLQSVIIGNGVTTMGNSVFCNCTSLVSVTLGENVNSMGSHVFSGCSFLTNIELPKSLTSIPRYAFYFCNRLTSITIPSSVTSIGENAFFYCYNLKDVYYVGTEADRANISIGSNNTYLTDATWHYGVVSCEHTYSSVYDPDCNTCGEKRWDAGGMTGECYWILDGTVLTIAGAGAMSDYIIPNYSPWGQKITKVIIEDGVTSIGDSAFYHCESLTSVTIPNSVTSIGNQAFCSCEDLTEITIPDSVTSIGIQAFDYCSNLSSIIVPDSVTNIGAKAFCCTAWYDNQPDGLIYVGKVALVYKGTCPSTIAIKDGTLGIAEEAFAYCSSLANITIPDGVKIIGDSAFLGCDSLKSVTIPSSVTSVGYMSFSDCNSLTSINVATDNTVYYSKGNCLIEIATNKLIMGCNNSVIPDNVTSIGDGAFYCCENLTNITIPKSVTSIGVYAFAWCVKLTDITIPNGVTSIGDYTFFTCSSLTNITIPDSVTSIGDDVFSWCSNLKDVYYSGTEADRANISIGSNNTYLTDATWHYAEVSHEHSYSAVYDPDCNTCGEKRWDAGGMTGACYWKLEGTSLTIFGMGAMADYYGYDAPWGKDITELTIEYGITGIGVGAFYYCTALKNVYISNSVKGISQDAFCYCYGLENITIGSNVNEINAWAFYGCSNIYSITVDANNTSYHSKNDCLIMTATNKLVLGCKTSFIPDYVTSIGTNAFSERQGLTSINIPISVTSIEASAFYNCVNLKEVYYDGSSLDRQKITINTGNAYLTEAIWNYAIVHEHSYTSVVTKPTCTEKGYTTYTCSCGYSYTANEVAARGHKGKTAVVKPTCTEKGYSKFTCDACGYVSITKETAALGHTYTDTSDPDCNVCGFVRSGTTGGCTWVLDGTVLTISKYGAMANYTASDPAPWGTNITKVIISYGVSSIGNYAFYGCTELTSISIANSVKTIGTYAFCNCDALTAINLPLDLTTIGGGAFEQCDKLSTVSLPIALKNISGFAFNGCPSLKTVNYAGSILNRAEMSINTSGNSYLINANWIYAIHEHVYGSWVIEKAATVDADGLKYHVCSCGEREEKVIPRVLNFKNKTLALQSNISIVFRVDPIYFTKHGYSNPVVIFTLGGVQYPVSEYTVNSGGLYEFAFNGVAPHQMKDDVTAVLTAINDGEKYTSAAQTYSIFTYCNNQITKYSTNATYKKLIGLLVDILNYGAAAQTYQGYNTNNLANASLTAAQKALGNQEVITYSDRKSMNYATVTSPLATFKAVSLVLKDSVKVTFKFELASGATLNGLTARFQVGDKTWDVDATEFTYEASSKRYVVSFDGLNPSQMRDDIYVVLRKDGKKVSNVSRYSVESYGLSSAAQGSAKLAALVEAMARYGRSAKAYNG